MKSILIACVTIAALGVSQALGAPVQWTTGVGHNYHWYERVDDPNGVTWPDARDAAALRTHLGNPGYLATITSAEENSFIWTNVADQSNDAMIGGFQDPGVTPANFGWNWVTGEAWSYTNWRLGEPNDNAGPASEQYLEFQNTWNDGPEGHLQEAYIVEYVPEPATLSLLALGGLALIRRRGKWRVAEQSGRDELSSSCSSATASSPARPGRPPTS